MKKNVASNRDSAEFQIDYREDGVYLRLNNEAILDSSKITDDILSFLDRKMVFDIEEEKVKLAVHNKEENTKIAPPQSEILINSRAILDISKDKMEANVLITPNEGGKFFTVDELISELNAQGIISGIDKEQINSIVSSKLTDVYLLVAKGKEPCHGTDAQTIYHFCTEKEITPTINSDGTINHKRLNLIKNVEKGDLLLEIIPATKGTEGFNVMGMSLPAKRGKDAKIKIGKNIYESDDKLKFFSAIDGRVIVDKNGKITVSEIFEVEHNVDNSTGNIQFKGTVIVRNNVRTGFSVIADADIHVMGVVEGATLTAKGNIIIDRGIQGNDQAIIECEGNLNTKFIENAKVNCKGDIEADFVLHSYLTARGKINLNGKKSTIAGGRLRAGKSIRAAIIGSSMGTITKLEVGIDPEMRDQHAELSDEIIKIEKKTKELTKTIKLLNKALKAGRLPASKKELLVKSLNDYKILMDNQTNLKMRKKLIDNMINSLSKGRVHVSKIIHPGVKISIIDAVKHVNEELPSCTLFKKDGEVTMGVYEK
ncbi:MAG: FapA family protein [Clostridiales bacterium]|nr:FapA family protein [Clostridiales bacterium]